MIGTLENVIILMLFHFQSLGYKNWASEMRDILSFNVFLYVWENQGVTNENEFLYRFEKGIKDKFLQLWKSKVNESSKLSFYADIKIQHCLESYLDILKIPKFRNALSCYLPNKYFERPNLHKLTILMSSKKEALIKNIALYIYYASLRRSNLLASMLQ